MKFWLEMGVDGFRLDAVPYLVEREGTSCENLPETHGVLKELRAKLDQQFPAKCCSPKPINGLLTCIPYFGNGDEFHMAFHFPLMPRMFMGCKARRPKTHHGNSAANASDSRWMSMVSFSAQS